MISSSMGVTQQTQEQDEEPTVITTPEGDDVTVTARAKTARTTHRPVTDKDGYVVYYAPTEYDEPGNAKVVDKSHEQAQPRPACALPRGNVEDKSFRVAPASIRTHRRDCPDCAGTADHRSKGSGNITPARRLLYGDEWGQD